MTKYELYMLVERYQKKKERELPLFRLKEYLKGVLKHGTGKK